MRPSLLPLVLLTLGPAIGACGGDALDGGIPVQHADATVRAFNRGVGQMERFRPEEAVASFEEVVRLAPSWAPGHLNLGIALLNVQDRNSLGRAERELARVLEAEPRNPTALYSLGMLFRHLGRLGEARGMFESLLAVDPSDADAHYQLGSLLEGSDPEAAREHYERTLERAPQHESACYRLAGLLRRAGEMERARILLERFRALKESGAGEVAGMKYGEMGRYAAVLRAFPETPREDDSRVPAFADRAVEWGLDLTAPESLGPPGTRPRDGAPDFGPGVAVADVDGDGKLDLYLAGIGPQGGGRLLLQRNGRFRSVNDSGIEGDGAIGACFGDFDSDGDPDLFLSRWGPNRLYRNLGGGRFQDATAECGIAGGARVSLGAAWADADHDGDLDLYVANFARLDAQGRWMARGAPNALWRNDGNGKFTDLAPSAGIDGGAVPSTAALFLDLDGDRDLDLYLVQDGSPNRIFRNDRVGRYREVSTDYPELADPGPGTGALLGDLDRDGREDLLLLRATAPPRLLLQKQRGRYTEDPRFAAALSGIHGATNALLGDLDLDGDLDLVLLDAAQDDGYGQVLLRNDGSGAFLQALAIGTSTPWAHVRGAVCADLDGNGALELLVARSGAPVQLWAAPPPSDHHWLEVRPEGEESRLGPRAEGNVLGLLVEARVGREPQLIRISSSSGYLGSPPPLAHFGLGAARTADYLRLEWPDAVLQNELEIPADQIWEVRKIRRKPSSCPLLFCWDGRRFAFVSDFLGAGGLGFFETPGVYGPPDPTEDLRIPPSQVAPRAGLYLLRVVEPLEEVSYLDQLRLRVYDHPADREVYPDERFATGPPFPSGRPRVIAEKVFPRAARDQSDRDRLPEIQALDRRYVRPPLDPRFVGYARDHWLELDFGDRLNREGSDDPWILFLDGWVEYSYSHLNYAAWQAGVVLQPPWIELPTPAGDWRRAAIHPGFPAGLPRTMTVDLSSLDLRDGRLRIRSNMEIYWDRIYAARDLGAAGLRSHELRPLRADLRQLGYPREYSPDGADPTLYDYQRLDQGLPFKAMSGPRTPCGDVRDLLQEVDDRFVILSRGEELRLAFDSGKLPPLPSGWTRTLVLHADGYCKDMDLYTAFPDSVGPLPRHDSASGFPDGPRAGGFGVPER